MPEKRFCPNCGSENVEPDTSNAAYVAEAGGNPNTWSCNECGYTGMMPEGEPEDIEAEEIDFEPDEEYPQFDIGFGRAYLRYLLYIAIPVLGLYLLYIILI